VRVAEGVQVNPVSTAPDVEAERLVEALRLVEYGHREHEAIERMHADDAGTARRYGVWSSHHDAPGSGPDRV
jgi:hypothetical protein